MQKYTSNYDLTRPFSDTVAQIALGVGVEQTYTVPGPANTQYSVRFSYTSNSNVFVRLNAAPTTPPAGSVTQQPYSEFRPGADGSQRYANAGQVIHFITPDATAYVGISLMAVNP